jgi:hypothetical protein
MLQIPRYWAHSNRNLQPLPRTQHRERDTPPRGHPNRRRHRRPRHEPRVPHLELNARGLGRRIVHRKRKGARLLRGVRQPVVLADRQVGGRLRGLGGWGWVENGRKLKKIEEKWVKK